MTYKSYKGLYDFAKSYRQSPHLHDFAKSYKPLYDLQLLQSLYFHALLPYNTNIYHHERDRSTNCVHTMVQHKQIGHNHYSIIQYTCFKHVLSQILQNSIVCAAMLLIFQICDVWRTILVVLLLRYTYINVRTCAY